MILNTNYKPTISSLINDYLEYNPTRNRALDMLPLFAYIDKEQVLNRVDSKLIKARPTFHYRLPNCDMDNPDWSLAHPWSLWLKVEQLANNKPLLETFVEEFREDYQRFTRAIDNKWVDMCDQLLQRLDSQSAS
jgi:hypothetical protein